MHIHCTLYIIAQSVLKPHLGVLEVAYTSWLLALIVWLCHFNLARQPTHVRNHLVSCDQLLQEICQESHLKTERGPWLMSGGVRQISIAYYATALHIEAAHLMEGWWLLWWWNHLKLTKTAQNWSTIAKIAGGGGITRKPSSMKMTTWGHQPF